MPLGILPAISAGRVVAVARLQSDDSWGSLARFQLYAASVSLTISLPILIATRSMAACAIQLLCTEVLFTILARRAAVRSSPLDAESPLAERRWLPELLYLSLYGMGSWLQGQADRLLLGILAGPSRLGAYSLAWSTARTGGEAAAISTANVLRSAVAGDNADAEISRSANQIMMPAVWSASILCLLVSLSSEFVLDRLLSEAWIDALAIVPVLALSTVPTLCTWSLSVVLVARRRVRWAPAIQGVGVLMSIGVASAAMISLTLAAWIVVLREVLVLCLTLIPAGRAAPWKAIWTAGGLMVVLGALAAVL
jgi:O-antigen/teichoic acid export membrane protein